MEVLESFIWTPVMAIEILVAENIFFSQERKRDYFALRVLGSSTICIVLTVWIEIIYFLITDKLFLYSSTTEATDSLFKLVYYSLVFLMTILCMWSSYNAKPWMVLLHCSAGYVTQHMGSNIISLVLANSFFANCCDTVLNRFVLHCICSFIVYSCVYRIFVYHRKQTYGLEKNIHRKVFISFIIVFICIGLSRITTDDMSRGVVAVIAESTYAIVSCILVLNLLYGLSENDKMKYEVEVLAELLHRDREQYKMAKENIEIINMKCHDLKHHINNLSSDWSAQQIKEVEDSIMIYNSVVNIKTGNDVLDMIITEKSLLCEKNAITLTCMANGEALDFIDRMDLYSLFGNALSNAIESVTMIEEEAKRSISLNVKKTGNMLSIHVENPYKIKPVFLDGIPISQGDKNYHGFGMKSMDYIVKKYDGVMSVSAKDGIFYLDFIIPVRMEQAD